LPVFILPDRQRLNFYHLTDNALNLKSPHYRLKPWKLAYHLTFHSRHVCALLPELYALLHPNFFKFHVSTSSFRVFARILWNSLPLSVRFCESQLSGSTLKHSSGILIF